MSKALRYEEVDAVRHVFVSAAVRRRTLPQGELHEQSGPGDHEPVPARGQRRAVDGSRNKGALWRRLREVFQRIRHHRLPGGLRASASHPWRPAFGHRSCQRGQR